MSSVRAPRRLLAISWDMPPQSGPRAIQVTRTLNHLVPLGWDSTVVCFGPRSNRYFPDPDLARRLRREDLVRTVPVRSPEEWLFFRALWRVCGPARRLPDEQRVWVGPAVRAARRAASLSPFDILVTFAQPWSDHLAGWQLHRELGLPWVAHFSDPWVDSPYVRLAPWQRRIWERLERRVVRDADALVFVCEQTAERVMSRYPSEWRSKAAVVPHGHQADMLPEWPAAAPAGGTLRVVHTGRFYRRIRTPEHLLRGAAAIVASQGAQALALTFVGTVEPEYLRLASRLGLEGTVTYKGRLSWADSMTVAMTADVLLVIDAPSDVSLFLPSKLIDYLPLNRPLLGLTPAVGASADVLRALGYPIAPPDDAAAIERALTGLIEARRAGRLLVSPQHERVSGEYDIRRTAGRFAEVLSSCLRQN